jgi:hypothetical protein
VWGIGEVHTEFWLGNLRERDHFEDVGVDGRVIIKCIFMKRDEGDMDYIDLAWDRNRWRAFVNVVLNSLVP